MVYKNARRCCLILLLLPWLTQAHDYRDIRDRAAHGGQTVPAFAASSSSYTSAVAEVYEWIDAQGRHHYSDKVRENAKVLKIDAGTAYYRVDKVFDGDTIRLGNGQKVRFLGINTPEVAGRNKAAEPGGEQAKAWLTETLEHKKVALEGDVEKRDKYQRTLAYVFTEDKLNVNLELVKRGLAVVNIYPPNLKYVDAFLAAQQSAEQAGLGLWGYPEYAPLPFENLNKDNYRGWKRITGRIRAVKHTARNGYLQFSDSVSIQIPSEFSQLFPPLETYVGKEVEGRGWVNKSGPGFSLLVRHPGEIKPSHP